jgi:hypothetical protein
VANGDKLQVRYIGDWLMEVKHSDIKIKGVMFKDVIVVPNLSRDLLSMARIDKAGGDIIIRKGKGVIRKGDTCLPIRKVDNMYLLDYYDEPCEEANVVSSPKLWHQRFGHINYEYMRQMGEIDDTGVPKGMKKPGIGGTCERGKQTKMSFSAKSRERAKEPLELVHTDVLGPVEVESLGGARYAIGFTDDYSRWKVVYPMKHKSESLDCLKRYIQDMNVLQCDCKMKTLIGLRFDNGGEYTGINFKNFCKNHGIRQDFSMPYGPQDNGVAEKSWHIISNMARSLRIQAGLEKRFWAEALDYATYLWNRSRNSALGAGETPYYKMFGKHANRKHLRVFGCKSFVHDTSTARGKFDDRALEGIMIGYDDIGNNPKCYRIYIPSIGKYIKSGHVTFDEATFPAAKQKQPVIRVELHDDAEEDNIDLIKTVGAHQEDEVPPTNTSEDDDGIEDDLHQDELPDDRDVDHVREDPSQVGATGWKDTDNIIQNMNNMGRTRSRTKAREHHRLDDGLTTMGGNLAFAAASEIVNEDYHHTKDESEVPAERKKAKDAEYQAHMRNGTWELTTLPKGERCITSGWVEP